MFSFFLPKETSFFDLFDQHAAHVASSVDVFTSIWTHQEPISRAVEKIDSLEQRADAVTHQIVELLHKTFITPIDRDEIFRLISRMDDIIDNIKAASDCLVIYKIDTIHAPAKEMVQILGKGVDLLQKALKGLRIMDKEGGIKATYASIIQLKDEADLILQKALGNLFDQEPDARIIIKWKEIYERLDKAIDRCKDSSNIIEGVILEYM